MCCCVVNLGIQLVFTQFSHSLHTQGNGMDAEEGKEKEKKRK